MCVFGIIFSWKSTFTPHIPPYLPSQKGFQMFPETGQDHLRRLHHDDAEAAGTRGAAKCSSEGPGSTNQHHPHKSVRRCLISMIAANIVPIHIAYAYVHAHANVCAHVLINC